MLNPLSNWIWFVFSDAVLDKDDMFSKSKGQKDKFSTYLCFMDINKYKMLYEEQDDLEDQNLAQDLF